MYKGPNDFISVRKQVIRHETIAITKNKIEDVHFSYYEV